MKKRLLSIVLALALALPMLPAAWAALPNEPRYYELNPYTNASLLGLEADGAYHFKITIAADGAVQSMPLFLASVYASMETSDQKVVGKYGADGAISGGVSYCGRSPGTATVTLSLGKYQSSPKERQAVIDVTVLSPEDFAAYAGDDATHSVQGHTHTYTTTNTPDLGRNLMLHRKVCTECGQWYNMAYERLPDDFDPGTDPNPTPAPDVPHTHNYTSKVTKQPTATQPGVRTYTCTICDDTYTETIPATGVITTGTPIEKTPYSVPAQSWNIDRHNYSTWSSTVKSYLYQNENGGLTRLEYTGSKVVVEEYDSSFRFQSGWSTKPELPEWGGFYRGEDYNYLIFGQDNPEEDPGKEVIRVVQYTKDWQRIKSASLSDNNVKEPFNFGSLRCAEHDGYLYIRTCRTMFKSGDGLNHQSNLMVVIRENDMTVTEKDNGYGYVSHSFNQFLLVDETEHIISLDHGDGYPRAAVLRRYKEPAGQDTLGSGRDMVTSAEIVTFPGKIGENDTGCSLGGLEETSKGYVVAYNYDGMGGGGDVRDIYLSFTDKSLSATSQVKITSGVKTATPQMVSTGLSGGYVFWNEQGGKDYSNAAVGGKLYYAVYDANGKIGAIKTATAPLSDCKPIVYNGKLVWYATSYCEPVFYILDDSGVRSVSTTPPPKPIFEDVPFEMWYTEPVKWAVEQKITTGTSSTKFSPDENCTHIQILTFLYRASQQIQNPSGADMEKAVTWARGKGMIGSGFSRSAPCTRADAVTYIWQAFDSPTAVVWSPEAGFTTPASRFSDIPANTPLADAVSWAVVQKVTNGTNAAGTTFSPDNTCTRGEIVTFLYRAYN